MSEKLRIKKIRTKSLEELISQPRKIKYDTYEFDELSYTCLLLDIKMLILENKKYKEVINKLSKLIYKIDDLRKHTSGYPTHYMDDLVDILKEVEHE